VTETAAKVVDASAIAAILFDEPGCDEISARLTGSSLLAPALIEFEIVNVCLTKMRRRAKDRDALLADFEIFSRMDITIRDVNVSGVLSLAEATDLTGYDASYLWLALEQDAELVTLDKKLNEAVERLRAG
jgi:predicted nucleic acid-binding protein